MAEKCEIFPDSIIKAILQNEGRWRSAARYTQGITLKAKKTELLGQTRQKVAEAPGTTERILLH